MNNTNQATAGQAFVPYAVVQPYSGIQIDIYSPLTESQSQELIELGFRRDKMNRQRWFLASRPAPFAGSSFSQVIEAAKHFAA